MRPSARRGFVLTFHGIGVPGRPLDAGEEQVWVDEDHFDRLLETLARRPDVLLTFDDGNRSDRALAAPALTRSGLRGIFFISAARIGRLGFLSRDDLVGLVRAGMEVGLHGSEHRPWRGLSLDELQVEIHDARRRLEDAIGVPVRRAACPFGAYDRRVLSALRKEGFEQVYTSDGGPAALDAWLVPRTTVFAYTEPHQLEESLREQSWSPAALLSRLRAVQKRNRPPPFRYRLPARR